MTGKSLSLYSHDEMNAQITKKTIPVIRILIFLNYLVRIQVNLPSKLGNNNKIMNRKTV